MKRTTTMLMMAAAFLSTPIALNAQQENPRGIYKMMTLTGKQGEIKAPYDQYKVCTDDVTLMVVVQNNSFRISDNDRHVFNYTGEEPKDENDKSTLIYNSNAQHFTEKWWSENKGHLFFPDEGWCIEEYEADQYTAISKVAFDAMTGKAATDAKNLTTGTWRFIGYVDELRDVKKALPKLQEQYPRSRYYNSFWVFTPKHLTLVTNRGGGVNQVKYDGKKTYTVNNQTYQIKWLSKDRIAIEDRIDYRTDWMILERVTDGVTPLERIVNQYAGKNR